MPSALNTVLDGFYLNDEAADVYFIVGFPGEQYERIPAHKFLLIAMNQIIQKRFTESWKDKPEIRITDASPDAFKDFLQFFYLNQVILTTQNIIEIVHLANTFKSVECLNLCNDFLSTLSLSELQKLVKKRNLLCEKRIRGNTVEFINSPDLLASTPAVIRLMLSMDSMTCTEMELFEGVMRWIRSRTNLESLDKDQVQAEIGNLFYKFRFGTMSIQEFAKLLASHENLFSKEETNDIIQMIASPDFQSKIFENNRRKRNETEPKSEQNGESESEIQAAISALVLNWNSA